MKYPHVNRVLTTELERSGVRTLVGIFWKFEGLIEQLSVEGVLE